MKVTPYNTLLMILLQASSFELFARDYSSELYSFIEYSQGYGSQSKASDTDSEATKADLTTTHVDIGYGYLWGDRTEPIFELGYKTTSEVIGNYSLEENTVSGGVGMLFNVPVGALRPPDADPPMEQASTPMLSYASMIPYGGFVVLYRKTTKQEVSVRDGTEVITDVATTNNFSKLVFGIRFMVFPHVGLNSSIRVSYREGTSEATTSDKTGGSIKSVLIEARLLTLSLFF